MAYTNEVPKDMKILLANVDDMVSASNSGVTVASAFLNPREQYFVKNKLAKLGVESRARFFGGHCDSERARLLMFPEYAEQMIDEPDYDITELYMQLSGEAAVCILEIKASGFRKLGHRDYMGSIMALGIERSAIGDISVMGSTAYVFATPVIARYICERLEKVGRDGVKTGIIETLPQDFRGCAQKLRINDTVSSARLDCVAAALLDLSREAAQSLIRRGCAELNYSADCDCDQTVLSGDILSFRGYGKFRIVGFGGVNRRGRIRFEAEKYIVSEEAPFSV
jgi:RNA-binding protein YlmH